MYIHVHTCTCLLYFSVDVGDHSNASEDDTTAAFCLTLPGETLYLTPLLNGKKFRNRGNKDGAVRAFLQLEEEGLGKTLIIGGSKGTAQVTIIIYCSLMYTCVFTIALVIHVYTCWKLLIN